MTILVNAEHDPLDLCDLTVTFMLQLGTVNEIIKHQPDSAKAIIEKQQYLESGLKTHIAECERCRNSLKDF
jgi:hypothetical protein